jgi:hypothetical protein
MKFDRQKSFGYPVLRPFSNDYVDCTFEPILKVAKSDDGSALNVDYHFLCSANELLALIQSGKADYVLSAVCTETRYDHIVATGDPKGNIKLPKESLRDRLTIRTFIVAKQSITNYKSEFFHPEYGDSKFDLTVGDVLACGVERSYFTEREVFENITSIFTYQVRDDLADGMWGLDYTDDKVSILANQSQLNILRHAEQNSNNVSILVSSIFTPAVMQLLTALIQDSTLIGYRWAQVLTAKMTNEDLGELNENSDTLEIAQRLSNLPLNELTNNIFQQ